MPEPQRVLVVEDRHAVAAFARDRLINGGYAVEVVTSIAQMRVALLAGPFDAIVADLGLPNGEGVDVVRAIRELEPLIPLVVWTVHDDLLVADEVMRAGADDVAVKGRMNDLPRLVRQALQRREVGAVVPLGDQTKKDIAAVTEEAAKAGALAAAKNLKRRESDDPREHWARFKFSMGIAIVILAAAITLRIMDLIGEVTLVSLVFLAGVIVKGESIIGLVKAGKKQREGDG